MIRARTLFRALPIAALVSLVAPSANGGQIDLPRYPVCEPSAAISVACLAHPKATCIWLGDNEQPEHLFEYEITEEGRLVESEHWKIPLADAVGDVEAMVEDGSSVLAVGSHGRNSGCEFKKKRARIVRIERDPLRATLVASADEWKKNLADCEDWIAVGDSAADAPARALRKDVCDAIIKAENAAEKFVKDHPDSKKCPETPFNVEGAASVAASDGARRTWLGLRAPLVHGKAVLLRLATLGGASEKRIRFDGIALVDLAGKGIRELTTAGGSLWGIAGSVPDSDTDKGFLWRVAESALQSGATIMGPDKIGEPLPPTSEGLVVQPEARRAIILVDGGLNDDAGECAPVPGQLTVKLP